MNRSISKLGILAFLFLIPGLLFAQQGKVRGVVTDAQTGDPLPGANIVIEGTTLGASADLDGGYVILGVPPGVYTIRANFIGYQPEAISNIRVSSGLTTSQDFGLGQTAIQVDALEIVADRPIVQKNTTNTIRMTTQEDISNLAIRGLQNIIALNAGTVQQDGVLHIRGGRSGEVAYYVDGATATNPMFNSENVSVIQEAIEEIQMQAGGMTAEHGTANSGVVNTTIRTGGSSFKGTLDYRTDDFSSGGDEFLGTTSLGYHNVVATLGGPLSSKMRYFVAGQYNYLRNRDRVFIEPFSFSSENEGQEWMLNDGFRDPDAEGEPLPGPLTFEKNFLDQNTRKEWTGNGTLVYNMSSALKFRLTGSYFYVNQPNGHSSFRSALINYYDTQPTESTTKRGQVSLRTTHLLNSTTFYDLSLNYSNRSAKSIDPVFGDDWESYYDLRAWEAAGLDVSNWQSDNTYFLGPPALSIISDFNFTPPNAPNNSYSKNSQTSIGGSLDLVSQINKNIEVKVGGRLDRWTMRQFSVGNIRSYLSVKYGPLAQATPLDPVNNPTDRITLIKQGAINFFGWDIDGTTKINDGPNGPRHPLLASAYLQTKLEYRDLIMNLGIRYEKFDYDAIRPVDIEEPARDKDNEWIDESALTTSDPHDYLLPRVNFAFPITDRTVFYAQYGKYVQSPTLNDIYRGGIRLLNASIIPEERSIYGYFGRYAGFTLKPERTTQYELGFRQSLTEDFAFTATAYYKDLQDQQSLVFYESDGHLDQYPEGTVLFSMWGNRDIGTSKGLELTLELRRTKRLAARVNYTLSKTRGTGSDKFSTSTSVSDATITTYPTFIYTLDYDQPHRGSVMLDYRFAQGDGGSILQGLGINALLTFNSGHAYTKIQEIESLGQSDVWFIGIEAQADPRTRIPIEPVNSSQTPWNFNVDLNVDKMFYFNSFNLKLYAQVLNLFNTRNITNVYEATGAPNDDGWFKAAAARQYLTIPGYREFYQAINLDNRWAYQSLGRDMYGPPRLMRFGVMFEL